MASHAIERKGKGHLQGITLHARLLPVGTRWRGRPQVSELPFLNAFVNRALQGGAAPYMPPEARHDAGRAARQDKGEGKANRTGGGGAVQGARWRQGRAAC